MFRIPAAACLLAIAVAANPQSTAANPADCLFNWAETTYPDLLAPAGAPSGTLGPYYYRHYARTNAYLGTASTDLDVYYYSGAQVDSGVINVGDASAWLTTAACVNASSPADSWSSDGTALSNADFGGAQGTVADVTVLPLRDGRYRMFLGGVPQAMAMGIHSALSSDGVTFTPESGPRIANPYRISPTTTTAFSMPHVVRLDDGRVRLFVNTPQLATGGIYSLTSADEGVTFTLDPGMRIGNADVGVTNTTGPSIVKMKTSGWRMYFSDNHLDSVDPATGFMTLGVYHVFSAFSNDLLTWTADPGVRAGPGSAIANSVSASHPGAIANDDGSVTLIFFRNNRATLVASTSMDGLNFTSEVATPFAFGSTSGPGNDAFLMRLNTGEVRMYYDWGDAVGGAIYTARHAPFSASTSP